MMRRNIFAMILLSSTVGVGCMRGPHVRLSAPPADAPPAERMAAFEALQPRAESGTIIVSRGQQVAQRTDFLVLGDGRRVYHTEDLTPVVPGQSATAEAARRSKAARSRGNTWLGVSIGLMVAGAALTGYAIATAGNPGDADFGPGPLFLVGLGVSTVGIGTTFFAVRAYQEVNDERVSAFATYSTDLAKHLDVCVDGLRVVACETMAPASPPATSTPQPAPAAAPQ